MAAGAGCLATSLGGLSYAMACPFGAEELTSGHLIPEDKKLSAEWVRSLFGRGAKEVFTGDALENIGMPCGGIGTGQLYLCGDGTLGCWQIFNDAQSNWVEGTFATYAHRGIAKPVDQGFGVTVAAPGSEPLFKRLNRDDFPAVEFQGEYPIGLVRYQESGFPVAIEMEAFSPFIPLNAKDSGLPATLFHISVKNISAEPVVASVVGWLENAVCNAYAREYRVRRTTKYTTQEGFRVCLHSAEEEPLARPENPRPTIVFESFDGADYGRWTSEGEAFGTGPTTLSQQKENAPEGFQGEGFAGSHLAGDGPQGVLTSPVFRIERRYINFLISGGNHTDRTCVNLIVGDEIVRTSLGRNSNTADWRAWLVEEWEGQDARIAVVDRWSMGWGHIAIDEIEFSDVPRGSGPDPLKLAADYGTMALACADFALDDDAPGPLTRGELRTVATPIAPGESHTITFALGWHFPNQAIGVKWDVAPWSIPPQRVGHAYANHFANAAEVIQYVFDQHERLVRETRLWRDAYYDSTLPLWLLDRLHSTVSYLATGTCQWWENGRFWAYEGVACCHGTCTHVWNYAHTHARLFPDLARSVLEKQDLCPREAGGGFHPDTGLVGFRSDDRYAADGQCGTILKAYREHTMCADNAFLIRNWPAIKRAMEFSILHDANADGLIEDLQHNTYDINYHGANTFVGSLYLAALRAAEEMARDVGDVDFAKQIQKIFKRGSKNTRERLWNGEYYVQDVDLERYPQNQYKDGCLSDQLFGQGWAHQLGLGYLYSQENVTQALRSVWKYNWAPDIGPYNEVHKPFRWFVTPGQAGLITCTWPKSAYLTEGTRYREEVWTGIEYQVAAHMIWEGLVTEGLAICRAVHDRYHPSRFNPYNEVECGDHYARAMASWGVYLALAGFEYHGPKGVLGFAPRITPENFRCALTTAEAWIVCQQTRTGMEQFNVVEVQWGRLKLARLLLQTQQTVKSVRVTIDGRPIEVSSSTKKGRTEIRFDGEILLHVGEKLEVHLLLGEARRESSVHSKAATGDPV
jgi:uncharacterized protein (DUF608 family)